MLIKDILIEENGNVRGERQYITEVLPLIPLAIMGAGLAWTAYDAWKMKKAYDRGEISGADMAKAVGTDIALSLTGGAVGKVVGKGWKYGTKLYKSRKAAKSAEADTVTNVAQAVNQTAGAVAGKTVAKKYADDVVDKKDSKKKKKKKKRYYGYGGLGGPSEPDLSLNLGDKDIQEPVAQTFLGKKTRGQTGIAWA